MSFGNRPKSFANNFLYSVSYGVERMKLLHTSDWHLGIMLNERSRREEMLAFFDFLRTTIVSEGVDTLVISGDVFDTSSPSSEAENMYYNFLVSIQGSCCKDVVIIADNHDSPSKLRASKELLKQLNIHVYCNLSDVEPLVLSGAIIVPVPFLRDRELLTAVLGESIEQCEDRRKAAIEKVYNDMLSKALSFKMELNLNLPIIALGHVAVTSGFTPDKGLYLGGLGVLDASSFSDKFAYVALGHIHKRQQVSDNVWYCGSPIAMSFDEAKYEKSVSLVNCDGNSIDVKLVPVPRFRSLITVKGKLEDVREQLKALAESAQTEAAQTEDKLGLNGWISIQLEDNWGYGALKEEAQTLLADCGLEVLAVKNVGSSPALNLEESVVLTSLSVEQVFEQLLDERSEDASGGSIRPRSEEKKELMELFDYVVEQVRVGQDEN